MLESLISLFFNIITSLMEKEERTDIINLMISLVIYLILQISELFARIKPKHAFCKQLLPWLVVPTLPSLRTSGSCVF